MPRGSSLRGQLKRDLGGDLPTVAAVLTGALTVVALSGVNPPATETAGLALAIAAFIPYVYSGHRPRTCSAPGAIVWTVAAACVTTGVYVVAHRLAHSYVSAQYAVGTAFLLTVSAQYTRWPSSGTGSVRRGDHGLPIQFSRHTPRNSPRSVASTQRDGAACGHVLASPTTPG